MKFKGQQTFSNIVRPWRWSFCRRPWYQLCLLVHLVLVVNACSLSPKPFSNQSHQARATSDIAEIFSQQETVTPTIDLYQAMARAIKYNLDQRLKLKEKLFAQRQLDVASYELLPGLVADVGRQGRDQLSASSSQSLNTGEESLEPSTSVDRYQNTANLTFAWNILDFGVSYMNAKQQADRALIAEETRRQALQELTQEVRQAFWRALAAQQLLSQVEPLMVEAERAYQEGKRIERRRLKPAAEVLNYQRDIVDLLRQLKTLKRELIFAKTKLGSLMNLRPGQDFMLEGPKRRSLPMIQVSTDQLESLALVHRPEIRSESYLSRISRDETYKTFLRLLPGLEIDWRKEYTSNSFLVNNDWQSYSAKLSWNLLNLVSAPSNIALARAQEDVATMRRYALSVAIMTQVRIAALRYHQAMDEFTTAQELSQIENRLLKHTLAQIRAKKLASTQRVQAKLNALVSRLREAMAFAEAESALGYLFISVGEDPIIASPENSSVSTLAMALAEKHRRWEKGDFQYLSHQTQVGEMQNSYVGALSGQGWISKQPGRYFTIQLMASRSLPNLKRFMQEKQLSKLPVVETIRHGEPWYILLFGSYSSYQQAKQALDRVPMATVRFGPWVRSFRSITQIQAT